jgi:multidrug resistance efflux pump
VFESLRARLERFLAERTPPADPRERVQMLHAALLDAKVGLGTMRDALAASERELARERQHLDDAERRGRLAAEISDAETVAVAERFAARHRERIDVLERKIAVQRDELAIAEREYETMRAEVQAARGAVGTPPPAPEPDEDHLRGRMDRAAREAAADRQLEFLKKKVRGDS